MSESPNVYILTNLVGGYVVGVYRTREGAEATARSIIPPEATAAGKGDINSWVDIEEAELLP